MVWQIYSRDIHQGDKPSTVKHATGHEKDAFLYKPSTVQHATGHEKVAFLVPCQHVRTYTKSLQSTTWDLNPHYPRQKSPAPTKSKTFIDLLFPICKAKSSFGLKSRTNNGAASNKDVMSAAVTQDNCIDTKAFVSHMKLFQSYFKLADLPPA